MKDERPLWSPDKDGEFHLGDLMYNIEEAKRKEKKHEDCDTDKSHGDVARVQSDRHHRRSNPDAS